MKLATFTHVGSTRIGVVEGDEILDLAAVAPELPREMCALLAAGPAALARARQACAAARHRLPLAAVRLEAPILRPPKFLAIGINYADHVAVDDVSVRDWQLRVPTWTMGKSFDTHGPIGPWITTPDEVGDPHALRLAPS
jgi:2-keto-4-pentenoate hydratase/2-oxohepta-3-ene-1,7-dioic acid hydratase in catechol pathway